MNSSLRMIHRWLVAFAIAYLFVVGSLGYHLRNRLQSSEQMASHSRHMAAAINRLLMLSGEEHFTARTESQWQRNLEHIRHYLTLMQNELRAEEMNRVCRLLDGADEVFLLMKSADNATARNVYAHSLSSIVQDLSLMTRYVHEKNIISERQRALKVTFTALFFSLLALALLAIAADWAIHRHVLGPILDIANAIQLYGRGNRSARAPYANHAEMDALARTFNQSADTLAVLTDSYETELSIRKQTEALLRKREQEITAALAEKEALLREIHHRVKNNMQVIVSLLNIHSRQTNDLQVERVFQDCRDRIDAMALIHETLYQSDELNDVHFASYLDKLCRNLCRAYNASGRGVEVVISSCTARFNTDQCIAIGMILAELIANAFKHAFPDERGGRVEVQLTTTQEGLVELSVSDNGIGVPDGFDVNKHASLGLRLVVSVIERDLGGSIRVAGETGTRIVMQFPVQIQDEE